MGRRSRIGPALGLCALLLTGLGCPRRVPVSSQAAYAAWRAAESAQAVTGRGRLRLQGVEEARNLPQDVDLALTPEGEARIHFLSPFGAPAGYLSLDQEALVLVVPIARQAILGSKEDFSRLAGLSEMEPAELARLLLGELPRLPSGRQQLAAEGELTRWTLTRADGEIAVFLDAQGRPERCVWDRGPLRWSVEYNWEDGWTVPRVVHLQRLDGGERLTLRWAHAPDLLEPGSVDFRIEPPEGYQRIPLSVLLQAASRTAVF